MKKGKKLTLILLLFASAQVIYSNDIKKIIEDSKEDVEAQGLTNASEETTYMTPEQYTSSMYQSGLSAESTKEAFSTTEEERLDVANENQNASRLFGIDWYEVVTKESFNFILGFISSALIIALIIYFNKERKQHFLSRINFLLNKVTAENNHKAPASFNYALTNQNLIKSILIGIITAILLGFIFSDSTYYYHNEEQSFDTYKYSSSKDSYVIKEEFNYKVAFISSALVVAFMIFVYYDEKRKQFILIKTSSLFTQRRIEKAAVENVEENPAQKATSNSNDNLAGFKSFKSELINVVKEDIFGMFINFKTRLPRGLYFLYMCLINLFFYIIFYNDNQGTNFVMQIVFSILGLYFLIKIYILRLHDMNYSGWNSLFCLIPLFIIFIAKVSNLEFLDDIMLVLSIPAIVFIVLFHILLLLIPGTKGNNHYGSN